MRSLCTMNPVSTPTGPPGPSTKWVSAWPPSRESASYNVTDEFLDSAYAAVRPATPLPTTATRRVTTILPCSPSTHRIRSNRFALLTRRRYGERSHE